MKKEIIVFTLLGCGHCKKLKKQLTAHNKNFTEIEITANQDVWNQVVEQTGYNVLPTVFIRNENTEDGVVFIPGKDFQNEDEIIKLIDDYT